MGEQIENKMTLKKVISLIAVGLAALAIVLYIVLPAIKIDQSFAFGEQLKAGKEQFINLKDWSFTLGGFGALFGGATYDVIRNGTGAQAYDINIESHTTSFNVCMLIGIIIAVLAIALYLVMYFKKIKNNTLNKVVAFMFIAAALMVILTAVWFYAFNEIEESNYYNSVTKLDTTYKFCNAHLSAGPIVSGIFLIGSGVCTIFGEY